MSKYNIGIIGAGHIGSVLAKHLVKQGHSVVIANSRGPETLKAVEKETGAKAVHVTETIKDIVIVTIPFNSIKLLPKNLFNNAPKNLVVIDTCNYYPGFRDEAVEVLDNQSMTHSQYVSQVIGHPVIKVFNTISTYSLEFKATQNSEERVALPIAGDDQTAKAIVFDLVVSIGFDPVDAGSLSDSWRQQPGTPCYCCDWNKEQLNKTLLQADRSTTLKNLAQQFKLYSEILQEFNKNRGGVNLGLQQMLDEGGNEINEKLIDINRSFTQQH
ncbi:hypothetical protein ABK040_002967 [Willaertia magna]